MKTNPFLTVYKKEVEDFINLDFVIEKLDDTCSFSEGPIWNKEGFYLFSDIPENVIYKIYPGKHKEIYLNKSGYTNPDRQDLAEQIGSNGLTYDNDGNLLICQHGNGVVARYDGKIIEPFITTYNNKTFNSPNDIVVDDSGRIFFSDPPYGLKDQQLQPGKAQSFAGFYCWEKGELKMLCDKYNYPNGLCISTDKKSLYTCSAKQDENFVLEYDLKNLELKRILCYENSDGMKCDGYGNIFLTTNEGIVIINNNGERLAKISLETIPANCCWGGVHLTDLFITARQNILIIKDLQKQK